MKPTLAEDGRLASYVDEFKSIATTNGRYIVVKCAFQMISKIAASGEKVGRHRTSINSKDARIF